MPRRMTLDQFREFQNGEPLHMQSEKKNGRGHLAHFTCCFCETFSHLAQEHLISYRYIEYLQSKKTTR